MKPIGSRMSPCGHQKFNGEKHVGIRDGAIYQCKRCRKKYICHLVPAVYDMQKIVFEEVVTGGR